MEQLNANLKKNNKYNDQGFDSTRYFKSLISLPQRKWSNIKILQYIYYLSTIHFTVFKECICIYAHYLICFSWEPCGGANWIGNQTSKIGHQISMRDSSEIGFIS